MLLPAVVPANDILLYVLDASDTKIIPVLENTIVDVPALRVKLVFVAVDHEDPAVVTVIVLLPKFKTLTLLLFEEEKFATLRL